MTRSYPFLDVMKFVASVLVIMLHTNPIGAEEGSEAYAVEYALFRNAVPFFFVCSAFFLYSRQVGWADVSRYVRRMFVLYAAWFLLMLPYTVALKILHSDYPLEETILRFYRSLLWTGAMQGAWFLFASMQSVLLIHLLSRVCRLGNAALLAIGGLLYAVAALSSAYWGVTESVPALSSAVGLCFTLFSHPSFTFFSAFIFFVLGKIIAEWRERPAIPGWLLPALCAVECAELCLLYRHGLAGLNDNFLSLVPFAFCFFLWCLRRESRVGEPWSLYMRKSSIIYFLSQFPVIAVCRKALSIGDGWALFAITLACTSLFSYVVIRGSRRWRGLGRLY